MNHSRVHRELNVFFACSHAVNVVQPAKRICKEQIVIIIKLLSLVRFIAKYAVHIIVLTNHETANIFFNNFNHSFLPITTTYVWLKYLSETYMYAFKNGILSNY